MSNLNFYIQHQHLFQLRILTKENPHEQNLTSYIYYFNIPSCLRGDVLHHIIYEYYYMYFPLRFLITEKYSLSINNFKFPVAWIFT